ncbi:MAG: energy-coupled thiamine transporter ThiT [Lachnospiraceae bacterium]|nr:energy-coupled thiamine transporter ThiT [Lachnospiraceae bacterium]
MQHNKTNVLVEGAIMIALATVLSFIRVVKLPWGGSITLLSMLPIVLFSIRRGIKAGLTVSFLFSLVQFIQGIMDGLFGWGLTPGSLVACIFLDYLLAFTVLGLAGLFRKKGVPGWIAGIAFAILLRFTMHFLSGVIIWQSFGQLWGEFFTENTVLYSLLYNGAYMLPEMIFTIIGAVVLLKMPKVGSYLTNASGANS